MLKFKTIPYILSNKVLRKEKNLEIKEAVIGYQYGEKIKSCLIIATKLLDRVGALSGEKMLGAQEILMTYLDALLMEIGFAVNSSKSQPLKEAKAKVQEAIGDFQLGEYARAGRSLSQAISKTTTCCQRAMIKLKDEGLI